MSASKKVMASSLACVQRNLMGKDFEEISLQSLLPIIFEECLKENLTFWFSFIENTCVLNLRDTRFDNYELNIRQYIGDTPFSELDKVKLQVLINAFLIVPGKHTLNKVDSSEQIKEENTKNETVKEEIQESDMVPPSAIRLAIEECKQNKEPINKKNLESKLNLKGMTQNKRRQCIAYLKGMGE